MATVFQPNVFQNNVFQIDPIVVVPSGGDGRSKRGRAHRWRRQHVSEGLTEGEAYELAKRLARLKKARTEKARLAAAQALEEELAQVAEQHEEAAEIIAETIQESKLPAFDYAGAIRDVALMGQVIDALKEMARRIAIERDIENEDEEILLLMQ